MNKLFIKLKHFNSVVCSYISHLPMPGGGRWRILRIMGINFPFPHTENSKFSVFIGQNVAFDTVYPEDITINNHVHITAGCVILTHYLSREKNGNISWRRGKVTIEEGVFIGTNSIITHPVTIGKYAVIGAGSVVTRNIPPGELWAGVPAKFIKKLDLDQKL